jgi:ATP-dependent RNA helicase RhlB
VFVDGAAPNTATRLEDLHPVLCTNVKSLRISKLLPIQSALIPLVLGQDNIAVATESGTGKSTAYLMAATHDILSTSSTNQAVAGPRVLIILPTHELASETMETAQELGHGTHLSYHLLVGRTRPGFRPEEELPPCDVVIATPGQLNNAVDYFPGYFGNITWMIVDHTNHICREHGMKQQFRKAFTGIARHNANFARVFIATEEAYDMWKGLVTQYIDAPVLVTTEHPQRHVKLVWKSSSLATRDDDLVETIRAQAELADKILVFTHSIEEAEQSMTIITNNFRDWEVEVNHSELPKEVRRANLEGFLRGDTRVLVCCKTFLHGLNIEGCDLVIYRGPPHWSNWQVWSRRLGDCAFRPEG